MTAAIYTRTAFNNDAAHRTQRNACTDLADRIGATVTHVYAATGTSRLAFDKLRTDAAAGEFDSLIVASHDRLSRSATAFVELLANLDAAGVSVYVAESGDEPIGTTSPTAVLLALTAAEFGPSRRFAGRD